jgi:hypothetical protein
MPKAKTKRIHGVFTGADLSNPEKEAQVQKYINSEHFTPQEYRDLLSNAFNSSEDNHESAITKFYSALKGHQHDTPANNDKIYDALAEKLKNTNKDDDYWDKRNAENAIEYLKLSPEKISKIIKEHGAKSKRADVDNKVDLSHITKQPLFNSQHLDQILDNPQATISNQMVNHPAMTKNLFDKLLQSKNYESEKLPGSITNSQHLDENAAAKLLARSHSLSSSDLNGLLDKLPPERRKAYVEAKLGMLGGQPEKSPEDIYNPGDMDSEEAAKWNNWTNGKHYDKKMMQSLAASRHLTPEAIEHIKHHGDFDSKYNLFQNSEVDPKHATEMLSHWDNDDDGKGYALDDFRDRVRDENEDDKWERYSEEAREDAAENYPWKSFISDNYNDDELSNAYFDKSKEDWKKEHLADKYDWNGPNPEYKDGQQNLDPNEEQEPPTIDYANHSNSIGIEDHPEYAKRDAEADKAWQEAIDNEQTPDQLYENYDESINDDVSQRTHDLFENDLENATSQEDWLPNHVVKAIKQPWSKNSTDVTPEQLDQGLKHPLGMVRKEAAKHPNLPPELISKVLADNNNDNYSEEAQEDVMRHNNVRPEHISQVIANPNASKTLKELAIKNPNANAEHLHGALDQAIAKDNDSDIETILDHPNANEEHARKALAATKDSNDTDRYTAKKIFDNKFKLTPDDIQNALSGDNDKLKAEAISHHAATRPQVDSLANHPNEDVREAVQSVYANRFPKNENQVNVKLGTHPLRQLRDYVAANGGQMKKQDFKAAGVNTNAIDKLFGPKGTITSQDIQNHIDAMPATTYNSSIADWEGAQRHSDKKQNVFQMNYTEDQLQQMQKAGVLGTFRKLQEHTFSSGHPVKKNTLGWVRFTGNPGEGFHVDEVQTDLGQSLIKKAAQQAKEAVRTGAITPEQAADAMERAKDNFPEDHLNKIQEIAFNGRHPSEVIHEAFKEHMRNKGLGDTPIHIWQPESKAPISGQQQSIKVHPNRVIEEIDALKEGQGGQGGKAILRWGQKNKIVPSNNKEVTPGHLDQLKEAYTKFHNDYAASHGGEHPDLEVPLPVHMQEGYGKIPKAMKYQEGHYGELPTQDNPEFKGKPTYKDIIRKAEPAPSPISDATKAQLAQTLQNLDQNKMLIEQLRSQAPDVYNAISEIIQSLMTTMKEAQINPDELQAPEQDPNAQPGQEQQAPAQQQQGQAPQISAPKDKPITHGKKVYAPGSERTYGPGNEKIKKPDGSWQSLSTMNDPDEGSQGQPLQQSEKIRPLKELQQDHDELEEKMSHTGNREEDHHDLQALKFQIANHPDNKKKK